MRPSARRPRARAALALAVAALALAAGPARAAVTVGLSDASPYMVGDHRFAALGVRHVRLVVPWDAARTERAALDLYVKNATVFGADVHVAFEHARDDRCPGSPCTLPSVAEYGDAVAAFRARYPQVTTFTAWNEANHVTQPTRTAPAQAARYFAALRARCAGCTVVAGDVLAGQPGLGAWLDAFRAEAGPGPLLWGVHDYGDANRGGSDELDAFLGMVDGEVWITETGGIVRFATEDGRVTMPYDEGRAAQAVAYALDLADARAPRVTRAYLHSFTGGGRMDTGLVGTDGRTRPGYDALLAHLRAAGVPPSPPPWEVTNEPPPLAAMVDPAPAPDAVVAMPVPRGGALALRTLRLSARAGAVRAALACPDGARCRATLRLRTRRARGRLLCGPARLDLAPGATATVRLRCARRSRPRAGWLEVAQRGRLPVTRKVRVRWLR